MSKGKIDSLRIGLRSQDIQTSLQDVNLGALSAETKNIRLVGMAERLAIHIRGADVIDDYRRLEYIASQFGIDSLVLPSVFGVLEELDWVRIEKKGNTIKKVEESIPYFSDIYSTSGEYFSDKDHTEIEDATIEICDSLSISPRSEEDIKKQIGIDDTAFKMILDIGKSGKIVDQYKSDTTGETILYSPLFWAENPAKLESMYALLKEWGVDRIYKILEKVKNYQGLPLTGHITKGSYDSLSEDDKIIIEMIRRGIILTPKVNSFKGEKHFAFTPNIGIPIEEKVILEKAMCILACIRYGEHFGSITKIKFPEAILDKLLSSPYTIGPHSEIMRQYAILVGRGIGKVFRDTTMRNMYYFQLIQTDENKRAVKLARDLLRVGEVMEDKGLSEDVHKVLFYPGSYEEAMRTLPKLKKSAYISKQTYEKILDSTMDVLRGG